jgi:predicted RNA-binding Zn ribbon-like protein
VGPQNDRPWECLIARRAQADFVERRLGSLRHAGLAVDLANTEMETRSGPVDLLASDVDLDEWVSAQEPRFPVVSAAQGRLREVRRLRDAVRAMLFACLQGEMFPGDALAIVNEAARAVRVNPELTPGGAWVTVEGRAGGFSRFRAEVGRSLIELISGSDAPSLARCGAPNCGLFFLRTHWRQEWCTPGCGNRARVARSAQRRIPKGTETSCHY